MSEKYDPKKVIVTSPKSSYCGEQGVAIRICVSQTTADRKVYDVIFPWDVSSIPVPFAAEELEFING